MAQETAPQAIARLVAYAPGKYVALPPHATVEIVEHPKALPVPGAAHHAHGLLAWQGRHIAMIDLQALVAGRIDGQALSTPRYALVVAYQRRAGEAIEHGALALPFLPETITVSDDAACALPQDSASWPAIAISCFAVDGQPVPVVDTSRLFAGPHG